ncbi:MAG: prepilin-type N-terminal cleavage/methylation domain-containing protein, partial [Nitrospirota bacterium]
DDGAASREGLLPFARYGKGFSIHRSQSGFTLMEALLALAILSIIFAALYSTYFLSQKAMDGVDDSLVKLQECRMAVDVMSREMDSILFGAEKKNSLFMLEDRDIYGKQTSRLIFTAFSPLVPGLSVISYYVEEKEGKLAIFKKINSVHESDVEKAEVEFLNDIEAFEVKARINDKWIKNWDSSEGKIIPEELLITITVLIKDRKVDICETVKPKIGKAI